MNNITSDIDFRMTLEDVNWDELTQSLVDDDFHNGRTSNQLKISFANSYLCCMVWSDGKIIGTARILSDGVCNAYLVDVWTQTEYRHRGIATEMVKLLMEAIPGQHIGLFAEPELSDFYRRSGFIVLHTGFEKLVGEWLNNKPTISNQQRS